MVNIKEHLEIILIGGGAIMALWKGLKNIYKLARNVETLLTNSSAMDEKYAQVVSRLEGHTQRESDFNRVRDTQLLSISQALDEISKEIRPNGGSSMKDTINKCAKDISDVKARLALVEQRQLANPSE